MIALGDRMSVAFGRMVESKIGQIKIAEGKLEAFNPANVLQRGYSLTLDAEGRPVTDCQNLNTGDTIQTRLRDGVVQSTVEKIQAAEQSNHG